MTTITYQQLQIQSLITFDYMSITKNFKTIDSFIKNFSNFQRKFSDLQKSQKANAQDLTNFKLSTSNTFSTMNQILDSRGNISKGNNKAMQDDVNEVKKSIKDLKSFVTESTRQLNFNLQLKQKETQQVYKKYDAKLAELYIYHQSDKLKIENLQSEIYTIKNKYSLKIQTQNIKSNLLEANQLINQVKAEVENTKQLLQRLGVKQFKQTLDTMSKELLEQLEKMKIKLKLKTDFSDTLKLEEMLLNTINFSYESVAKKFSSKGETKKALIFLQKKINTIVQTIFTEQQDKDGLIATKNWKCISCTKDLGQYQGKLDKFKAWSVFPVKQAKNQEKYGGFGSGFQTIIETAVTKKGGQISYDQKGRMTTPFNLTREVQANLKHSNSQSKMNQSKLSPTKLSESNYMNLFGRNSEIDIDIRTQYIQKEKGLMSSLKKDD